MAAGDKKQAIWVLIIAAITILVIMVIAVATAAEASCIEAVKVTNGVVTLGCLESGQVKNIQIVTAAYAPNFTITLPLTSAKVIAAAKNLVVVDEGCRTHGRNCRDVSLLFIDLDSAIDIEVRLRDLKKK